MQVIATVYRRRDRRRARADAMRAEGRVVVARMLRFVMGTLHS
jgi:hypothetical protein